MQATILGAEVRRGAHGPDRVTLATAGWGDFTVDVPRGGGPEYCAGVGLGSCKLVTSDGFEPKSETVELGPKSRPVNTTPDISFATAQITEPEAGGATVVLDTRGGDGSNAGPYEQDFELQFETSAQARAYLVAHGFVRATVVKPRPRKSGKPGLVMLAEVEKL